MIIDDFLETFGLSKDDLAGARGEGEHFAGLGLRGDLEVRQDMMTWLLDIEQEGEHCSSLRKIASAVSNSKGNLNSKSQEGKGERSLRVDKEYF